MLSLESIKSRISRQNASIGKVTGRCVDWKMKFCYYTNRCVINRTSAFLVIHDYKCIVNHRKPVRNFQIIVQFVYNFTARVATIFYRKYQIFHYQIEIFFYRLFYLLTTSLSTSILFNIYKSVLNILKIEKKREGEKRKRKRDHESVILFHRDKEFEIWNTRFTKREIVAQTNRERRNKGFFGFIARQVIGLRQAGFLSLFFHVS